MKLEQILPTVSLVLNFLTFLGYVYAENPRKATYWLCCAVITYVMTY